MLQRLFIQNYALIEEIDITLSGGMTIITGETGAGKSILLGALGLLVGERADSGALQDKTKKCVVEGTFLLKGLSTGDFFTTHDLDYDDVTTIRREINPEGKSRAFVNDTPVSLTQLKELGTCLVDIHSQHETLELNDSSFQLSVVDAYSKHTDELEKYVVKYKEFKALQQELNALMEKESQARKELDYFQFQWNELEEATLVAGEQEKMEEELQTLNHAETIKSALSKAAVALANGEQTIISSLNEVKVLLTGVARYNSQVEGLNNRIQSALIELKDIAAETDAAEGNIIYDPQRIEMLDAKLGMIYKLQQKHQVKTVEELITIKNKLNGQLLEFSSLESTILKQKKAVDELEKKLRDSAQKLSQKRITAIPGITKDVKKIIQQLGMPNAELQIEHSLLKDNAFNQTGIDRMVFLFSANKGSDFKELNKVASGGELSRLMLSIKSIVARSIALPAIVFDEIDTGVSGDVADKVGHIMEDMATAMQVITITHLPQIASKGKEHLFVYKEDKNRKTFTRIRKLSEDERVTEIAKMLSTENPTIAAIKNARELLGV